MAIPFMDDKSLRSGCNSGTGKIGKTGKIDKSSDAAQNVSSAKIVVDNGKAKKLIPITELLTLTVAQAAQLLGWRRQLVDQAIHAGRIKVLNYPGVTRISRKELDRFIESLTAPHSTTLHDER